VIDETTFTLDDIADAHARLEAGRALGKVVVEVPSAASARAAA
jgi:NADPH:quinone reductase-like Zn-dependent oxidoreductase